jgi:hypothetical protein
MDPRHKWTNFQLDFHGVSHKKLNGQKVHSFLNQTQHDATRRSNAAKQCDTTTIARPWHCHDALALQEKSITHPTIIHPRSIQLITTCCFSLAATRAAALVTLVSVQPDDAHACQTHSLAAKHAMQRHECT